MIPFALAAVAALQLAQAAPAAPPPKRLVVLGDNVKVRATPAADGVLAGYLFRNMVVDVLERGAQPEVVGGIQDYWYRVARGNLTGWSFGGFFSAAIPARLIDTYDVADLDGWWGNRFGWSTEYMENGVPEGSLENLEMDDYRGLIMMASSRRHAQSGAAWSALLATVYPFLKKHPDDPKWQYLRDKVWDPTFVGEMAALHGGAGIVEALPAARFKDPAFKAGVCARAGASLAACAKPAAPPR